MNPVRTVARLSNAEYAALVALAIEVGFTQRYHHTDAGTGNTSALIRALAAAYTADPTATAAALVALLTPGRAPTPPAPPAPPETRYETS